MAKLAFLFILLFSKAVFANPACIVCTVAMGTFLGVSRALGISDNATGVWIGALILMIYFFCIKFSEKKNWTFKFYHIFWALMTLLLVPTMYLLVPYKLNTFFGIDSFLLSMIAGAITFYLSQVIYQKLKERHGGHAHFPFEKVVFAVVFLLIVSVIFNYL
ncbi:MAG: hypothetical protein ACI4N3_02915 [Alphaproteobacteria bacterium]